jgi:hypothetical protein
MKVDKEMASCCASGFKKSETIIPIRWVSIDLREEDLIDFHGTFMPGGSFIISFESNDCRGQIELNDKQLATLISALSKDNQQQFNPYVYPDEAPITFHDQFPLSATAFQELNKEQS